jgi:phage gpG-like protein
MANKSEAGLGAIGFKVTGDKELRDKINKLASKSEDLAKRVVGKTTLFVIGEAKKLVNKDTTRLEGSITGAMKEQSGLTGKAFFRGEQVTNLATPSDNFTAIVGTDVEYAAAQEFGSRGKPYLRPAINRGNAFMHKAIKGAYKHLKP